MVDMTQKLDITKLLGCENPVLSKYMLPVSNLVTDPSNVSKDILRIRTTDKSKK